ncbi:MAG: hypothetical protein PHX83_06945 [Acidobacteriia bacterium]|nr:hypothetical protein [Terriglobia bacterium]
MGCKPKKPEEKDDDVTRLTNVRPFYISLVDYGANHGGRDHHFALKSTGAIAKRVPDADAENEDKQKALAERATSYGIEAREDAALSYPADSPTTEAMYGDPVNLKYPTGDASNTVDVGRIRNALARFKQAYEEYKKDSSRARVYARIVRAALDNGVEVSYDENDPVDSLLPADLKAELQKPKEEAAKNHLAFLAMRAEIATLATKLVEKSEPVPTPKPDASLDEIARLHATVKSANDSVATLKKENVALVETVKSLETKLKTALAKASRVQRPATTLAGMHPNGEAVVDKGTAGTAYKSRYTGRP